MEHVWFTHGISCAPTKAGRRDERGNDGTESESGGKRASAGKGRRGLENLAACWISFFPLEKIFTFSSVDYRRRLFERIDARSGGRRSHEAPHVSVSTWLVRGRRNASLLVLSFVKLDARSRSVRCPLASLSPPPPPFFLPTTTKRRTTMTSREEIGVDWEAYAIMSFPAVESTRRGKRAYQTTRRWRMRDVSKEVEGTFPTLTFFSLDQPGNFDT